MSDDWIFSEAFLQESASCKDGIELEQERAQRHKTVWFMEDMAKELKNYHRKALTCALIFFHRFYTFHSFTAYNRFRLGVACLFLASKVEECPFKLKDIISAYHNLKRAFPTEAVSLVKDLK